MDADCGTGSLVGKALSEFPDTQFLLLDPSEGMLDLARSKLSAEKDSVKFLNPSTTQEFHEKLENKPDVITAIQFHHYLSSEDRIKAIKVCYDILKENGVFITFENIRPLNNKGIDIGKSYWKNFQLEHGKNEEEIDQHLARFDFEYFPITIEDHLAVLRDSGFSTWKFYGIPTCRPVSTA